ncbi:MAG: sensor histidine kinase [Deltaproteobacteria bacterium]|nr:sensor histidine kinase [Nannocystaceae bacterium]
MRSSLSSRWTVRAIGVLVGVLAMPMVIAYGLGLKAGEYTARSWLNKEQRATVSSFMRAELGELSGWARGVGSRRDVQRAVSQRDANELLRTLARSGAAPLWWLIETDEDRTAPRLVATVDPACAPQVVAAMGSAWAESATTVVCPAGAVVLSGLRFEAMPSVRLVAGVRVDQALIDRIAALTGTELLVHIDGAAVAASFRGRDGKPMIPDELGVGIAAHEFGERSTLLRDYAGFRDWYSGELRFSGTARRTWYVEAAPLAGSDRVDLVLAVPRALMELASQVILVIMAIGSVLVLVIGGWMLRAVVRRYTVPLDALLRSAERVARGDLTCSVSTDVEPEMARFCATYNLMLAGLDERMRTRSRLSRQAGMAELAVGMLHNVGNALNGVTSGAELADEGLDELPLRELQQLAGLLDRHRDDLPGLFAAGGRGQHLPAFVAELALQLEATRGHVRDELARVRGAVRHANAIVRAQERYAHRVDASERCAVVELVEESLGIACLPKDNVAVVRRYQDVYAVVDRHRLIEVVVNLLKNAAEAIIEHPGAGCVTVSIEDRGDVLRICIGDDGPGISPDRADRVFQFGYTTKPDGHGFGLHASCNATTEMGGTLRLEPVAGLSTCFVITLPTRAGAAAA